MVTDEEAKENIAANVLRLLSARGWSQKKLSVETGETEMTVSRICRGQSVSGIGVIARIAEALDVTIDRLIDQPPRKSRIAS